MKRFLFAILVIVLAVWFLFPTEPFTNPDVDGAYTVISGIALCKSQGDCIHEEGHAMDKRMGWISNSPEWAQALRNSNRYNPDVVEQLLSTTRNQRESYAQIYKMYGGYDGIPAEFKQFYSKSIAMELSGKRPIMKLGDFWLYYFG